MAVVTIEVGFRRRWLRWDAVIVTRFSDNPSGRGRTVLGPTWFRRDLSLRTSQWVETLAESYREYGYEVHCRHPDQPRGHR